MLICQQLAKWHTYCITVLKFHSPSLKYACGDDLIPMHVLEKCRSFVHETWPHLVKMMFHFVDASNLHDLRSRIHFIYEITKHVFKDHKLAEEKHHGTKTNSKFLVMKKDMNVTEVQQFKSYISNSTNVANYLTNLLLWITETSMGNSILSKINVHLAFLMITLGVLQIVHEIQIYEIIRALLKKH